GQRGARDRRRPRAPRPRRAGATHRPGPQRGAPPPGVDARRPGRARVAGGTRGGRGVAVPHVTLDGLDLWAEVEGAGPPVVLLHGFTGTSGTWGPLVREMGGRYTTIAFDHIGHGRSDAP